MRKGALLALVAAAVYGSVFSTRVVGQQGPQAQQVQLPDGAGKEVVQANCTKCHGLNMITNYWGDTRQGWETLFGTMIALPADQKAAVSSYLATHFPVKPAPEAKVIPGPVNVTFKEWLAPTLGSRPHDPLAAADGSIWWTGQFASRLGRVDPRTGEVKEFSLPAGSGPHGLIEDQQGQHLVHGHPEARRRQARSEDGGRHGVPGAEADPKARGPHTPIFDQKGNLWFTLQSGHVGRIVPVDRRDEDLGRAVEQAGRADVSVRHPGQLEGRSVVRGLPRQPHRQRRSGDDGDQGDHAAERRVASAPHRDHG